MKKVILLMAVVSIAITANAQKIKESEVPAVIKSAFERAYPKTSVKKWEKEKGNFEAEFDHNKSEMSVLMNPNGTILETETEIKVSELPAAVTRYCTEKYVGKKVKEASKIVDAKGGITYEAEVDDKDVIFDSNGKFVKEEKEDPNDKDKD